jgi:ABC-type Na+ efflux pump permease subunit
VRSVMCCNCGRRSHRSSEEQALLDKTATPRPRSPSLGVIQLTVFFSSVGFTVVLPTLFFYLEYITTSQHLSASSQQQFLGLVVGMYEWGSGSVLCRALVCSAMGGIRIFLGLTHRVHTDIAWASWLARFSLAFGATAAAQSSRS